jgi:short-subunit dehydrogenase
VGTEAFALPLDLAQPQTLQSAFHQVIAHFGQLDLLVNNAGISQRALARETQLEVVQKLMEVNYLGTVALVQACLPYWLQRGGGHVAVVTSLVGKFGSPMRSAYAASKHALHGYFDSLRAEHYADGLRVTLLCPGFVRTAISLNALTADGSPQGTMDEATNRGISPEVCARRMLRALRQQRNEAYIGGREVFGIYLNRFFPGLFARILRKAKVT